VLTPYKDLKTKFGAQQALTIYQEKKQLELNKGPKDEIIYFMKHPDCKSEDRGHMQKTFYILHMVSSYCFVWNGVWGIISITKYMWL